MTSHVDAELAAMLSVLLSRALAEERKVLNEYDLKVWDYAVLYALRAGPIASQAALADATGRDKTRLIGHLDVLEERGLIKRDPKPSDRRQHVISLTAAGRELMRTCHARIKKGEARVLEAVPKDEADHFLSLLATLTSS